MTKNTKIDIIYNATLICPWDCKICCVDAIHVEKTKGFVAYRKKGLTEEIVLPLVQSENHYNVVSRVLQQNGRELSLNQKIRMIENVQDYDVRLDISGGDPLVIEENHEFLKIASAMLGRNNITLTATGRGLRAYDPSKIAPFICEFNFTYDASALSEKAGRPRGYAETNLSYAKKLKKLNCFARAEFPLALKSISYSMVSDIYRRLHNAGIDQLLLMRMFPVGRGFLHKDHIPSKEEYVRIIEMFHELERKYRYPKVKLQCALRHLIPSDNNLQTSINPCDMVRKSFGLMADGTLLGSPWAINDIGEALGPSWILGDLTQTSLKRILESERLRSITSNLDDNFGHCKVQSYIYSTINIEEARMFDGSDPLYR